MKILFFVPLYCSGVSHTYILLIILSISNDVTEELNVTESATGEDNYLRRKVVVPTHLYTGSDPVSNMKRDDQSS